MKILTATCDFMAFTEEELEILKLAIEFAQDCWDAELEEFGDLPYSDEYTKCTKRNARLKALYQQMLNHEHVNDK